jgi:hypothetical protein
MKYPHHSPSLAIFNLLAKLICNLGNNTLKSLKIKSGSEKERKRVSN